MPGAEEGDDRTQEQECKRRANCPIERYECCSDEQIQKVRLATAEAICKEAEERIAQPLSRTEHQNKGRCRSQVQPAAALGCRQRKIGGNPGEKSPIAEHG